MSHVGIAMMVRYSHLIPEHKAQALAKLGAKFEAIKATPEAQSDIVSPELKEAIGEVLQTNLEQNRNTFLV